MYSTESQMSDLDRLFYTITIRPKLKYFDTG